MRFYEIEEIPQPIVPPSIEPLVYLKYNMLPLPSWHSDPVPWYSMHVRLYLFPSITSWKVSKGPLSDRRIRGARNNIFPAQQLSCAEYCFSTSVSGLIS